MVSFRSRIGDDGQSLVYESYIQLFPNIEDQESIVVIIEPDPSKVNVDKEVCRLVYSYQGEKLLDLDQVMVEFNCNGNVVSWNMFDNPEHIQARQDPKEKYEDVDPYSAGPPPPFDSFSICHGVLVQFDNLELPASFSVKIFEKDGSLFLDENGTVEP